MFHQDHPGDLQSLSMFQCRKEGYLWVCMPLDGLGCLTGVLEVNPEVLALRHA